MRLSMALRVDVYRSLLDFDAATNEANTRFRSRGRGLRRAFMRDVRACPGAMEMRIRKQADLATFLSQLVGASCVISFGDLADLGGQALPAEADAAAWWTGAAGWSDFAAARVCQTQGWRVEAVRVDSRLLRLVRIEEAHEDGGPSAA